MKSVAEPTDNFSTPNNLSPEKKMPPIITQEDTTLSEKKSSTKYSIESENSPISVPAYKVSSFSTRSEVELVPDLHHF